MNILLIIQRSNGDVFLTLPLIRALKDYYSPVSIDMLVNDDTLAIAKTLPFIRSFILFSYAKKKKGLVSRFKQEKEIIAKIWRQYDLAINLTASDRSVLYALLASKKAISATDPESGKAWWKKLFLTHSYTFDLTKHIVYNNCEPLRLLDIPLTAITVVPLVKAEAQIRMQERLLSLGISNFFIFHAGAQYDYKIYPKELRNTLLSLLSSNGLSLIATGGKTEIDSCISNELPSLPNLHNFIAKTSLDELIALVSLSKGYIGMDTLVMHIAASLNKPIFAIFGPTLTSMWAPWKNTSHQTIKLFQASMPCVPCGKAGCNDRHGVSECLHHIFPKQIADTILEWEHNQS